MLVSAGVLALLFPVAIILDQPAGYLLMAMLGFVYALALSLPFAVPGCLLVHVLCLRIRAQSVHVAAAAVAGLLAGAVAQAWIFGGDWPWFAPLLSLSTAIGRTAVVPIARGRQGVTVPVPVPVPVR